MVRDGASRGVLDSPNVDDKYLINLSGRLWELLDSATGRGGFDLCTPTPRKVLLDIEKAFNAVNLQLQKDEKGQRLTTVPVAVTLSEVLSLLEPFTIWDNKRDAVELDAAIMERLKEVIIYVRQYLEELLEEKKSN